jgi:ABC-type Mn2+/Zn2+ transport system permease subunit
MVAIAAGLVGSFALMKRMSLASDVVSHLALPGIGIALALRLILSLEQLPRS